VTLDDAYTRLGLKPPWEWEERVRERHDARYATQRKVVGATAYDRRIGSTLHMLIELYLDMEKANRTVSPMVVTKIKFLVMCLNKGHAKEMKNQLAWLHQQLPLYVNLGQADFIPFNAESVRGRRFPSWGIFCDHHVKEQVSGGDRATGPFRYIRRMTAGDSILGYDGTVNAFDRDENLVCTMPFTEVNDVLKVAECPILLDLGGGSVDYTPVSYPAWADGAVSSCINYTQAFQV
jgi:hypothetical protein